MAKAASKKSTRRSRTKRRSNPSTATILGLVALGVVAAGGAWWALGRKRRTVLKGKAATISPVSPMQAMSSFKPNVDISALRKPKAGGGSDAAATEAPANAAGAPAAPGAAPGVGGLPGPVAPVAP